MTPQLFDEAARQLGRALSRRALTQFALGVALARAAAESAGVAKARKRRKKRKHRKQPIVRNAFGCVDVGLPCAGNDANCCSGLCEGPGPKTGKKDASRCVAHDVGGCLENADICQGISPVCGTGGTCFRTTGKASFCGLDDAKCVACQQDSDCELLFGAGAACVVCSQCVETNGATCRAAAIAGS